mgnify:CR=1 FL=1
MEIIESLFQFLGYVWNGIGAAMWLNPRVFEMVEAYPRSRWVILAIVLLGGASLLLGQSVILFVNRVRPCRFVLSLMLNGLIFGVDLIIWAGAIWVIAHLMFDLQASLAVIVRMVGLGAAPYAFGFLVLLPYAGNFIGRALAVWSFLIVLNSIAFTYDTGFWPALVTVGTGWVLIMILSATIGKPVVAMRNRIWHRVAGSQLDIRVQDLLEALIGEQADMPPARKGM